MSKNYKNGLLYKWGTNNVFPRAVKAGVLPNKEPDDKYHQGL